MNDHERQSDVRDEVRAYYESQTLRPEKLNQILGDIEATSPGRGRPGGAARGLAFWAGSPRGMALAAGLLLALVLGGVFAWPGGEGLTRVVAQEIALNHNKTLKPDYEAVVFSDLSLMSDKLGFTPIEPASLAERGLSLQGGRYCSVQGCMAAQLRVVDADGGAYTLYQVRPDERLAQLDPATATVDGVDVELWTEAGLVMGLARSR
ncbi:hypothetical protein [Algisphaera agarilytica]|uniref:Type IV secretory pathway TrbD component n=1 Tax=Algisphaera agarilytica TaxID=1385975 RepID=A0A7X0LIL8_9BACT|nr:hypothetical protein [Algisphaera agarilytica]MBB6428355.1 type IV secretory pathway TrbD component [Algisphaera agarilytica]